MSYNAYTSLNEEGFLKNLLDYVSSSTPDAKNPITQVIGGFGGFIKGDKAPTRPLTGNIAKSAMGLTAVFPVIVTEATPLDQAVMVAKAVERKAVGMLEMIFAANQITNAQSAKDYLNQVHNNLSSNLDLSKMDVDDVLEYTAGFNEDSSLNISGAVEAVLEDCKRQANTELPSTEIANESIADFRVKMVFNELAITPRTVQSRVGQDGSVSYSNDVDTSSIGYNDFKQAADAISKSILDVDIKKANEAQPSLMVINFITVTDDNRQQILNTCVIGVKAMIHYVTSEDMINRIILKNKDVKNGLLNLIRATTREISFFKDFLFAIDRAKIDAVAKSGRGSSNRVWKLLELRAKMLKGVKYSRGNEAKFAAITTIVLSRNEIDLIKQHHRIDLNNTGTLLGIMRGYNLMATAIVDEINERVDFLYDDGTKNFETLSFMSLEREEAGSMYKKVVNLVKGR